MYRTQLSRPSPRKRNAKRQNGYEKALHIAEKRREAKYKGEKERYTHVNAEFQRIAKRGKKAFLNDQRKEIEENNRMGKTRDLFKKIEIPRLHFMQRWHNKGQKRGLLISFCYLTEAEDIKKRWQEYTEELYKKIFTTKIIMMV